MEKGNSIKLVEVCRSFSRTAQVVSFEPRNFFCSLKEECVPEDVEDTSKRLFHACKKMVEQDVEDYIEEHKPEHEKVITVEQSYKPKFNTPIQRQVEQQNYERNTNEERYENV